MFVVSDESLKGGYGYSISIIRSESALFLSLVMTDKNDSKRKWCKLEIYIYEQK